METFIKYIINEDNSFGGAFSEIPDGFNFTLDEPNLPTDKWNGTEWIDGMSIDEKTSKAIQIDLEYTKKIDDLMMKHYNKIQKHNYFNLEPYVVPQSAWNEEQALKDECNAKILALGITDFTYRQNIPKLAKTL